MSAFSEVVGQEPAVAALESQLARTGGAGSTLVVGPEGVGRFLLARCAAASILGPAVRSDLTVLESSAGIDGVRAAREALARKPLEGPRQVLILRDADRFSHEAHNAMLKTLEEPPADASIFLIARGAEFLPETVVSRCRVVRARPLSDAQCAALTGLDEDLAADAEGSPGRAVFHAASGAAVEATAVLEMLDRPAGDPLGRVDKLARRKSGEESKEHRNRMVEVLRVVAARLRRRLPDEEGRLRLVVEALGSIQANANAPIVFSELVLDPWKKTPKN